MPHRDTWYASPPCQVNWWLPIDDLAADRALALYPRYFTLPVPNTSDRFDYAAWVRDAHDGASEHVRTDSRPHPAPLVPIDPAAGVRFVGDAGAAVPFSGAHLHATVPNESGVTRFSLDFRTVHLEDVRGGRGAPNVDAACTGTTLGDFLCAADFRRLPLEVRPV